MALGETTDITSVNCDVLLISLVVCLVKTERLSVWLTSRRTMMEAKLNKKISLRSLLSELPWPSGYELRLSLERSQVRIPVKVIGGRQEGHPVQKMLTAPAKSQLTIGHRPSPVKTGSVYVKPHHQGVCCCVVLVGFYFWSVHYFHII